MWVAQNQTAELENIDFAKERERIATEAAENAKAKNARLRLMKARNEVYLAEQREYRDTDEDETRELVIETNR